MTECLSEAGLDRYLADGAGDSSEPEEHLAACPACRGRLADRVRSRAPVDPRPLPDVLRRRVERLVAPRIVIWRWAAVAAALLIPLVAITVMRRTTDSPVSPRADVVRSGGAFRSAPEIVAPANDARVSGSFEARWTPVEGVIHYVVRVVDERGDIVVEARSKSDRAKLEVPLESRGICYWSVEAKLADGRSLTSPVVRIVVSR